MPHPGSDIKQEDTMENFWQGITPDEMKALTQMMSGHEAAYADNLTPAERKVYEQAKYVNGVLYRGLIEVPADGAFTLTDPCYIDDGAVENYVAVKVQTDWHTRGIKYAQVWGEYEDGRPSVIMVIVGAFDSLKGNYGEEDALPGFVGVDSGQVVILGTDAIRDWKQNADIDKYEDTDGDYRKACDITMGTPESGDFMKDGRAFVTSTAFGDGAFTVYQHSDEFMVDFVGVFETGDCDTGELDG
jgi:hypothetical protein